MPSKLDYLSKYIELSEDKSTKKKTKQKKKKKKHITSSDYEEPTKPQVKETAVYDEDDAVLFPKGDLAEDDDDDIMAIAEEDRPTIVSEQDLGAHGDVLLPRVRAQPLGSWKTTASTEANKDDYNVRDDRPPTGRQRDDSSDDDSNQPHQPQRRYDSEDEENDINPKTDTGSASSPPQHRERSRHDSDEQKAKPEGTRRQRRRYDSDNESDGKKDKPDETMHKPKRRHGSEDLEEQKLDQPTVKEEDVGGDVRRSIIRNDSSEDEKEEKHKSSSPQRRRRYDSEDEDSVGQRKRRRFDLEDDKPETKPKGEPETRPDVTQSDGRAQRRYDSEDDNDEVENSNDNGGRRQRRKRYDSSDDDGEEGNRKRMASGHKAGLQNYKDFNSAEKEIQQRKQNDAQVMVDKYGMGETVYRDAKGRRTTKPQTPGQQSMEDQEQVKALNEGKLQRLERERQAQEMAIIQNSTFARHETDHRLEDMRKNEIRSGDPMAAYARKQEPKKKKKKSSKRGSDVSMAREEGDEKPTYKGPPPKPNRFGIRPGYRWDGVDRGNGWEDRLLAKQYMSKAKEEEIYRWRSADM